MIETKDRIDVAQGNKHVAQETKDWLTEVMSNVSKLECSKFAKKINP